MLMNEEPSMANLLPVELHAELQMDDGTLLLRIDCDRVPNEVDDSLPCRERRAHRQPTNNNGLSSLSFFMTLSRMTLESKSHSALSVSAVVKSNAKPGMIFNSGSSLVDTAALIPLVRSHMCLRPLPPNAQMTPMISSFASVISFRASLVRTAMRESRSVWSSLLSSITSMSIPGPAASRASTAS